MLQGRHCRLMHGICVTIKHTVFPLNLGDDNNDKAFKKKLLDYLAEKCLYLVEDCLLLLSLCDASYDALLFIVYSLCTCTSIFIVLSYICYSFYVLF